MVSCNVINVMIKSVMSFFIDLDFLNKCAKVVNVFGIGKFSWLWFGTEFEFVMVYLFI